MQGGNSGLRADQALRERHCHLVFVNWFSRVNLMFELFSDKIYKAHNSFSPQYEEVTLFKYAIGFLLKGTSQQASLSFSSQLLYQMSI
jgi:hypothetical protein